jgi:hypothetical protein
VETEAEKTETALGENGTTPQATEGGESDGSSRTNLRSTIAFPYGSLKDAEDVSNELHAKWGNSASLSQLAAGMDSTTKSGAFRSKVATARTFGVVTGRGQLTLTELGRRIVNPQEVAAARIEAFLAVPLFKAIYDEYNDGMLPPDAALEKRMRDLGVSAKQTDRARQSFQRSADLAGFFGHGRNRLVRPPVHVSDSKRDDARKDERAVIPAAGSVTVPGPIEAAWLQLLREGRSWSTEKTLAFIEATRQLWEVLAEQGD